MVCLRRPFWRRWKNFLITFTWASPAASFACATADSIPSTIYSIPPSSPVYNVTYVTQTNPTPTTVESSYTSGYFGTFVVGMSAVAGARRAGDGGRQLLLAPAQVALDALEHAGMPLESLAGGKMGA